MIGGNDEEDCGNDEVPDGTTDGSEVDDGASILVTLISVVLPPIWVVIGNDEDEDEPLVCGEEEDKDVDCCVGVSDGADDDYDELPPGSVPVVG